jgi:hypothetical protein
MAQFEARNAHATFFVTGNNIGKGAIDENWRDVISKMYANGHQIASHTWSHQNLDQITSEQRFDQMVKNEMALRNIIGKYPTYMRPPYSACDTAACQADLKTLGYVVTSFDLDTDDYNQLTKEKIQTAKNNFKNGIDLAGPNGDALSISHDIHDLSANNLTGYMLDYVYNAGWTAVTVGECMNDPVENWYRDSAAGPRPSATPSSSAPVPTPTGPTSLDGKCGTASGSSCIGFVGPDGLSECCSPAGWCGRSVDYCGTGCNPLFGKCGTQPSISAPASASVSKTSAAPMPTVSLTTSTTGECGLASGFTCKGFTLDGAKAECCSEYGYCGNTEGYCGATCSPIYGNCGSSGSSSSASASASFSTSQSATPSASATVSKTESSSVSLSVSKAASASTSASVSKAVSVSTSATVSKTESSSESLSVSKAASVGSSVSVSRFASPSAPASVSKSASMTESASVSQSAVASASPSASTSVSKASSAASASTASASASATRSGATPVSVALSSAASSYASVIKQQSSYSQTASASSAVSSATVYPKENTTKVYPSTMATVAKPSSTSCTDDKVTTPTPTALPVSKDGKCGKDNGGQTCKF